MTEQPRTQTIAMPDEAIIPPKYNDLVARADALVVNTEADYLAAMEAVRQLDDGKAFIRNLCAEPKSLAHRLHKSITTREKMLIDPLATARGTINGKAIAWKQKVEAAAEAERKRIADAEAARQREIHRREREERNRLARAVTEAADRQREEDERLQKAIEAEEAGDADAAEAILDGMVEVEDTKPEPAPEPEPLPPPPPVPAPVVPHVPKISGTGTRKNWSVEVVDALAALRHVVAHPELAEGVIFAPSFWNAKARSEKEAFNVPGLKAVCTETVSTRRQSW